jgi:integrase
MRRLNGEGCVIQLKSGTWAGQYTYNGKRKAVYGKNRQEAHKKLKAVIEEINKGLNMDEQSTLLSDWLLYWLEFYAKPRVKRSTYISYDGLIKNHVNPAIGDVSFKKLSARVFQEFHINLIKGTDEKRALSVKTVTNVRNMLHNAMEQAVLNDFLVKNYIEAVQLPKAKPSEERVLSVEEQSSLVTEARKYCNIASFGIILCVYTGVRKGELLGLQWRDVNETKRSITIRRALNRLRVDSDNKEAENKTEIVIGSTKTKSSEREIPLFAELFDELMCFKHRQTEEKTRLGIPCRDTDYIITNSSFDHIDPRYFETVVQRVAALAKVEKMHVHSLRHTFATRCLEAGMDIFVLSKILGHSQPSTTLNKYCHALPDHKRESMEKLSGLFIAI